MTTYNTGNPIGSTAVQDLYDNAQNLDQLVNTREARLHPDRFGVPRKTWHGMEQEFLEFLSNSGYEIIGTYGAGLQVTAYNQVFLKDGEFYRAAASLTLPYTTTGNWATEESSFVAVGDAVLRQDLAADSGASLVGYSPTVGPATTVESALRGAEAQLSGISTRIDQNEAASVNSVRPLLVDMHFKTLCGTGIVAGESGGVQQTTVTTSKNAGDFSLDFSNSDGFHLGQLITYVGSNGEFYTVKIARIVGNTVVPDRPLPAAISVGAAVYSVYANFSHPNEFGYRAIADDALRQLSAEQSIAYTSLNTHDWAAVSGASVGSASGSGDSAYLFPGNAQAGLFSTQVDTVGVGSGAASNWVALEPGTYRATLDLNPKAVQDGGTANVVLTVEYLDQQGVAWGIETLSISSQGGVGSQEINFTIGRAGAVRLIVTSNDPIVERFYLGRITYSKMLGAFRTLDRGKHIMLGDSWFETPVIQNRLAERLPNATFINAGHGGDNAANLAARVNGYASENPDYVWVMVGTNDAYQEVTPASFSINIGLLRARIAAMGAQAIFFSPSVGDANYAAAPGPRLNITRAYAVNTDYLDGAVQPDGVGNSHRQAGLYAPPFTVGHTGTVVVAASPGTMKSPGRIRFAATHAALSVRVGYSSTLPVDEYTVLSDVVTFPVGATVKDFLLPKTGNDAKYLLIGVANMSGGNVTSSLVADVAWIQD